MVFCPRWTPRAAPSPWDIPWEPPGRDRSPPCCPSWSDRARSDLAHLAHLAHLARVLGWWWKWYDLVIVWKNFVNWVSSNSPGCGGGFGALPMRILEHPHGFLSVESLLWFRIPSGNQTWPAWEYTIHWWLSQQPSMARPVGFPRNDNNAGWRFLGESDWIPMKSPLNHYFRLNHVIQWGLHRDLIGLTILVSTYNSILNSHWMGYPHWWIDIHWDYFPMKSPWKFPQIRSEVEGLAWHPCAWEVAWVLLLSLSWSEVATDDVPPWNPFFGTTKRAMLGPSCDAWNFWNRWDLLQGSKPQRIFKVKYVTCTDASRTGCCKELQVFLVAIISCDAFMKVFDDLKLG